MKFLLLLGGLVASALGTELMLDPIVTTSACNPVDTEPQTYQLTQMNVTNVDGKTVVEMTAGVYLSDTCATGLAAEVFVGLKNLTYVSGEAEGTLLVDWTVDYFKVKTQATGSMLMNSVCTGQTWAALETTDLVETCVIGTVAFPSKADCPKYYTTMYIETDDDGNYDSSKWTNSEFYTTNNGTGVICSAEDRFSEMSSYYTMAVRTDAPSAKPVTDAPTTSTPTPPPTAAQDSEYSGAVATTLSSCLLVVLAAITMT